VAVLAWWNSKVRTAGFAFSFSISDDPPSIAGRSVSLELVPFFRSHLVVFTLSCTRVVNISEASSLPYTPSPFLCSGRKTARGGPERVEPRDRLSFDFSKS